MTTIFIAPVVDLDPTALRAVKAANMLFAALVLAVSELDARHGGFACAVFLYVDYSVSVEEVRQELHRVLQTSSMWDGKTWGLQVTNAGEHSVELRALMSAPSGSTAWDLRCYVREKLIQFLQERIPRVCPEQERKSAWRGPVEHARLRLPRG